MDLDENNCSFGHDACYTVLNDYSKITNILFIDKHIVKYQLLVDSCNEETFPIVYNEDCSIEKLSNFLTTTFNNINRLSFIFHGISLESINSSSFHHYFLENNTLFLDSDLVTDTNVYSKSVQFIIDVTKILNVRYIDYLGCNLLLLPRWKNYFDLIEKICNVTVGASDNNTGNVKYGGDWIMESTNQDVRNIYFTNIIESVDVIYILQVAGDAVRNAGEYYLETTGNTCWFQMFWDSWYYNNNQTVVVSPSIQYTYQGVTKTYYVTELRGYCRVGIISVDFRLFDEEGQIATIPRIPPNWTNAQDTPNSVLQGVYMTNKTTSIGYNAFKNASNLSLLQLSTGLEVIEDSAITNTKITTMDFSVATGLHTIQTFGFYNNSLVTSVTIPSSIRVLQQYAFSTNRGCLSYTFLPNANTMTVSSHIFLYSSVLETIVFSDGWTIIPEQTCGACPKIINITWPRSLLRIEQYAFSDMYDIQSIILPNSLTYIGNNAFNNAKMCATLKLGRGPLVISSYAFGNLGMNVGYHPGYIIPNTVVEIKPNAMTGYFSKILMSDNCIQNVGGVSIPSYNNNCQFYVIHSNSTISQGIYKRNSRTQDYTADYTAIKNDVLTNWTIQSKTDIETLYSIAELAYAGMTFNNLVSLGYTASDYYNGIPISEHYAAGVPAATLLANTTYTIEQLVEGGYPESTLYDSYTDNNNIRYSYSPGRADATVIESPEASGNIVLLTTFTVVEESVTVTKNVTILGVDAFLNNHNINSIIIPSTITHIKGYALSNCTQLKNITIMNSNVIIDQYAFTICTNLRTLVVSVPLVNSFYANAFLGTSNITNLIGLNGGITYTYNSSFSSDVDLPNILQNFTIESSAWGSEPLNIVSKFQTKYNNEIFDLGDMFKTLFMPLFETVPIVTGYKINSENFNILMDVSQVFEIKNEVSSSAPFTSNYFVYINDVKYDFSQVFVKKDSFTII